LIARLAFALLCLAVAAGTLLGGLLPSLLRTGRVDPLDWLLPGLCGLVVLLLLVPGGGRARPPRLAWALVALPPALFMALAAARTPFMPLAVLLLLLAMTAWLMHGVAGHRPLPRALALLLWIALLGGGRWAALRVEAVGLFPEDRAVGLMTALPLGRAAGSALFADFAEQAPLVAALSPPLRVRPLDRLDAASLAPLDRLLLAQPRQLRADELVALDRWVRDGGLAVILADPLLRWNDPRPFGDPRRAPLTSLLDPLLAHWGLALAPADLGAGPPVERRFLADGRLLPLAGAAHFALTSASRCRIAERGLVARCRIGRGEARLVADADWLNDALWTAEPAHPRRIRAWTSDTIPMLAHLLRRDSSGGLSGWSWLQPGESLVPALRWSLTLAVLIAAASLARLPDPSFSQAEAPLRTRKRGVRARGDPDST
jgi:hypothetical protein